MNPKISIAIPTFESYGKGAEFLDDLLRTIEIQTFKDFEVVISDHSEDNEVFDKVGEFEDRINFCYSKNRNDRGNGPANTNRAIDMCSGDIIKIMFQDDFFYDDEALEKIYNALNKNDEMWLLNGCNHTADHGHSFYWDFYPEFNDELLDGVNTISSPSVVSFKKEVTRRFDPSLTFYMDLDFYYGMRLDYGMPILYNDILISNRFPSDYSVTTNVSNKNKEYYERTESEYCKKKYNLI
ncbi:MAG: glycosyltransferase family 2 protein [Candidatus Nanopelagicaceae bacterium]